jgi:ribulose-phosphate 3-epimerase
MAYERIEIAPSVLAADFARLGEQIRQVEAGGADVIHFDVMDGHFVPNISIGIPVLESLRKATRLPIDVHLMIENPELYIEAFVKAGGNRVLVHQEATVHLDRALAMVREAGAEAGAVINPATPVAMLTDVLDKVDTVLVMSVNPGFGGQKFIPRATQKVKELNELREKRGGKFRIALDGGIELQHVAELARAGANTFIAGTSIFRSPDPAAAVRKMRNAALAAASPATGKRPAKAVTPVSTMPSRRSRKGA